MSVILQIDFDEHPDDIARVRVQLHRRTFGEQRRMIDGLQGLGETAIAEHVDEAIAALEVDGVPVSGGLGELEYFTGRTIVEEVLAFLVGRDGSGLKRTATVLDSPAAPTSISASCGC